MILFVYYHRNGKNKSLNESLNVSSSLNLSLNENLVFSTIAKAASDKNSINYALGSELRGKDGIEWVNDLDSTIYSTISNRPYLFKHSNWNRSTAVSIHTWNFSVLAIVFVSALIGFILISLFQR